MILIDYNAVAISSVVTQKLDVDENLIRHMILNSIRMYRAKFHKKYGEIVICTDGKRNWRYDVFPNYKFKRKDARKESKMDWNELFRITNMVLEEIKENFPYKVIEHKRCEADDIIATIVESTQEFGRHEPVVIVSSDKDFVQLQKYDNVDQFSPMKKNFIKDQNPRKQLVELILKGDQADGIPNVLSGDDCFVTGVRQTPLRQAKIDEMIADIVEGELLYAASWYRNYQRNKKLIDLSETPHSVKEEILNTYDNQKPSTQNVLNYLVSKRCRLLIESVGDFI